jgi:hypothetical protein
MSKRPRKYIALYERLAAALALLLPAAERDELRSARAPARQVIARFAFDHNVLHALGGADAWWNLTPMLREQHVEKSRRDTAVAAKVKRVERAHRDFMRRLLRPRRRRRPPSRWPRRRFARAR